MSRIAPDSPDQWPCQDIFNIVTALAERFNLAFVYVQNNINFIDYGRKSLRKPWKGNTAPGRVVIVWETTPMDPSAILSWRCGLIEEGDIAYKFIFYRPGQEPDKWEQSLIEQIGDWAKAVPAKEKTGIKVGDLVSYNTKHQGNIKIDYDPSFLTISPSGKMSDVLEQLDECKRMFRNIIGKKVKNRRELVHADLEPALALSVSEGDATQHQSLKNKIEKYFPVDRNRLPKVLLLGPSGVGKTLVARYLAWATSPGPREELTRPFKRVPCPEYLNRESDFEYDVFGYCAGAFTGQHPEGKKGFLLERLGGVVFFDEIGDASPAIQAKLLAYLDDYQVTPRGWSGDPLFCPMLVVAATNMPIDDWADDRSKNDHERLFRNDLFQRFNYIIRVPSLNERKNIELSYILDIMLQMEAFNPSRIINEIGAEALIKFLEYDYRNGNFRELEILFRSACRKARNECRTYLVKKDVIPPNSLKGREPDMKQQNVIDIALIKYISNKIVEDIRIGVPLSDEIALLVHGHPYIDHIRDNIALRDLDILINLYKTHSIPVGNLAISLLMKFDTVEQVKTFLHNAWDEAQSYERKKTLMWRLLDDPDLQMPKKIQIRDFVYENIERFLSEIIIWYDGKDKVLDKTRERLADKRFPTTKAWAYLIGATASSDTKAVAMLLRDYLSSPDEFTTVVARELLTKIEGTPFRQNKE